MYGFPRVLVYFRLFLIVGPRLIFAYLMISDGFAWFSYGFAMLAVDFNRRYIMISDGFVWFSNDFDIFWLILIVGPRPIFGYLMMSYSFV